jgi:hypothetical protein
VKKWLGNKFNPKERALQKQLERGNREESLQLLVDTYYQSGKNLPLKQRCVHELVHLKALADPYLDVYINYLQHTAKDEAVTEVRALLADICNIDLDSGREQLLLANHVATHLRKHNLLDIPGFACVQGLHALLVLRAPAQAAPFFAEALKANTTSHIVQIGLLTSLIRQQHFDAALSHLPQFGQPLHPQVEGLVLFLRAWHWLEDSTLSGPLPVSAQQLELLNPVRYVGPLADLVIGRLHLLEGNARQSLNALRSAASQLTAEPRWHYYIAWASTLVGDREGVANSLKCTLAWSGNWTIACLLLDLDPEMAQQYGVLGERAGSPPLPPSHAAIFHFRTAQTGPAVPQQLVWQAGTSTFEEDLEALRSQLGAAFMAHDAQHMQQLLALHLFARLPLADQLFWRALYALLTGDQEQGSTLLDEAATRYAHPRAALVLALHLLQYKRTELAGQMMELGCIWRNDAKVKLLFAYSHLCHRDLATAQELLLTLADRGYSRASYALGNLWMLRAREMGTQGQVETVGHFYAEAARHFETALHSSGQTPPVDCARCADYARLLALAPSIQPATGQQGTASFDDTRQQTWNEILPQLFSDAPALVAIACENLLDLLQTGPRPKDSTCVALALLIAHTCQRAAQIEQAEKMLALLKYLATDANLPPVQQCLALVARLCYQKAHTEQHPQLFQQIKLLAGAHPGNFALRLLAASLSLQHEDPPSATTLLAEATFADPLEQHFQATLRNALPQTPVGVVPCTDPIAPQIPAPVRLSYYMLQAASAFATHQPAQGYEAFTAAAQGELATLSPVVDLRSIILSFCAYSQQQREEARPLLEKMLVVATRLGDSEFSLSVARLLADNDALAPFGQHLAAVLSPATDPEGRLRREWSQLHCYQATVAYKAQNYLKAVRHLRLAATFEIRPAEIAKLKHFADRLEGEACVRRLLALQEKEAQPSNYSTGRYRFLAHAIQKYPPLHQALIQESDTEVQHTWAALLQDTPHEISFLHGLAIIYRELSTHHRDRACPHPPHTDQACPHLHRRDWACPCPNLLQLNVLLWGLLLCTDEFWHHFTHTHSTLQNASGQTLSALRETEVMQQAIENLLSHHSILARRHLKEGHIRQALIHLRCLELCRSGTDTLINELHSLGVAYNFTPAEHRMQYLQAQAEKYSQQCLEEKLQDAYNATTNPEAVKTLPDGIRKYYQGGIMHLEPFIELLPDLYNNSIKQTILLNCLEIYVDWCEDLFKAKMCEKLIDTTHSAFTVADKFRALCTKSKGQIKPEQRAISSYRAFQALTQRLNDARPLLKEALEWNPYNTSAKYWLGEVLQWQKIAERVQPRIQHYSSKDLQELFHRNPILLRHADEFPLVYLLLNLVPPSAYRKPRAWGEVPDNRSSQVSKPAQPTTAGQPRKPTEADPISQFTRLVESGYKALAARRYDEAADYLTRALEHTSDDEQHRKIKRQLSHIYNLKGEKLLPEMQRRKQNGEPYSALLRQARTDFETALEYDAGNRTATEHLTKIKL